MPDGSSLELLAASAPNAAARCRRLVVLANNPASNPATQTLVRILAAAGLAGRLIAPRRPRGPLRLLDCLFAPRILSAAARADALVLHSALALHLPALWVAAARGIPRVAFLWDIYPPPGRAGLGARLWRAAERAALRLAGTVLVPSADYRAAARDAGARSVRVHPLPPPAPARAAQARRVPGPLRIGYAGALDRLRDPIGLIGRRCAPGQQVELHLFTPCPPLLRQPCHQLHILWRGWHGWPELAEHLAGLDYGLVAIAPDHRGPAFPQKVATYIAAGVPVLLSGPPKPALERYLHAHGAGRRLGDRLPDTSQAAADRACLCKGQVEALAALKRPEVPLGALL